jgi:acyl transferase domain-containing protein
MIFCATRYSWSTRNKEIQILQNPDVASVLFSSEKVDETSIVAVSSFSFGGSNAHVLLKNIGRSIGSGKGFADGGGAVRGQEEWKNINPIFGRSAASVSKAEANLAKKKFRCSDLVLPPSLHFNGKFTNFKAFSVEGSSSSPGEDVHIYPKKNMDVSTAKKPPVVLLFSGNGGGEISVENLQSLSETSQIWRNTWAKCREHLQTAHNLDLDQSARSSDDIDEFAVARKSVTLCAVQICQVNLLQEMGVESDYYLGHSAGETAMGYADGTLTLEQALSVAYLRAKYAKVAADRFRANVSGEDVQGSAELAMVVVS